LKTAEAAMATPVHDQIMLWLDANMGDVALQFCKRDWSDADRAHWKQFSGGEPMPEFAMPCIAKKVWESAIGRGEGRYYRIEGHIDMAVHVERPFVSIGYQEGSYYGQTARHRARIDLTTEVVFFEVKPKIESLGEVIRQLRRYQKYASGVWVVVSPDTRYANILREQGIEFLQAPGSTPQLGL
jgi:hypothetical protein